MRQSAMPRPLATLGTTLALALACLHAHAQTPAPEATPKPKTMQEVLASATDADWRALDPARTLYMELDSGRAVIELAPAFAPEHVANIVAMAKAGYWDGMSIHRVQDNFVTQWGDPAEDEAQRRPLPEAAKAKLPAEFSRPMAGLPFWRLPDADGWAPEVGFSEGFAAARDPQQGQAWLAHCYGTVGAGRDTAADSSTGAELYVVIGQSPRQLDLNITTVGRVVQGMELLSALPRGDGPLGFYTKAEQRTPIRAIRLAAAVPEAERTALQVLRTDTPLFAALVEARRNRRDDFYKRPAGHIDLCNVPLPTRAPPAR